MARVNITVPDELPGRARAAGLDVSRVASAAWAEELDRREKIAGPDACLAELEAELGRTQEEAAAAQEWADRVLPSRGDSRNDSLHGARSA